MLACSGGDYLESKQLLEMLNKGVAMELNLSIKYMWQRILVKGVEGAVVENLFREITSTTMKNAEVLAERLAYLNGVPPNKIEPVHVGVTLVEMVKEDIQTEEEAVSLYRQAIQVAGKEGDFGTKRLLEDILISEEKNLEKFSKLLVGMTSPFTQP
jgi:bacterioferritin